MKFDTIIQPLLWVYGKVFATLPSWVGYLCVSIVAVTLACALWAYCIDQYRAQHPIATVGATPSPGPPSSQPATPSRPPDSVVNGGHQTAPQKAPALPVALTRGWTLRKNDAGWFIYYVLNKEGLDPVTARLIERDFALLDSAEQRAGAEALLKDVRSRVPAPALMTNALGPLPRQEVQEYLNHDISGSSLHWNYDLRQDSQVIGPPADMKPAPRDVIDVASLTPRSHDFIAALDRDVVAAANRRYVEALLQSSSPKGASTGGHAGPSSASAPIVNAPGGVVSVNQRGGITAGTVQVLTGAQATYRIEVTARNIRDGERFRTEARLTLNTQVAIGELRVGIKGQHVISAEPLPYDAAGPMQIQFGHGPSVTDGIYSITIQNAYRGYTIVVFTSQPEQLTFVVASA